MQITGLVKRFGATTAVDSLDLTVPAGSFFGLVGPNGAGKTTTLSMATGLLRPDAGAVRIHDTDVWADPVAAKRLVGNLSDGVRLFDRLTGRQLVLYAGLLHGMDRDVVESRVGDLLGVLDLEDAGGTLVVDYSAGMTKRSRSRARSSMRRGCWCWMSRSSRSTRCRRRTSATSSSSSSPPAAPSSSRAT